MNTFIRVKQADYLILLLLIVSCIAVSGRLNAQIDYDSTNPQLEFAAQELKADLQETGNEFKVSIVIEKDDSKPEAFQINMHYSSRPSFQKLA